MPFGLTRSPGFQGEVEAADGCDLTTDLMSRAIVIRPGCLQNGFLMVAVTMVTRACCFRRMEMA